MEAAEGRSISTVVKVVLDGCWYLLAIGLGLAMVALFLSAVVTPPARMQLGIPVSFNLDLQAHTVASPSLGIEGVQVKDARGILNLPIQRGGFLFANLAILVGLLTLGLWILSQLRAIFRTLREGRPFVPANARRIRWVGVGVIVAEVVRAGVTFFENYYTMTHFAAEGIQFAAWPSINPLPIVHGLIILAIAEVFRAGTRLEEDQSLTV